MSVESVLADVTDAAVVYDHARSVRDAAYERLQTAIAEAYGAGVPVTRIAEASGVSKVHVYRLVERWRDARDQELRDAHPLG